MRNPLIILVLLSAIATVSSYHCKKPYVVPESLNNRNYLVVDGFINAGDETQLRLSRTRNVGTNKSFPAETGARVQLQGRDGTLYFFNEDSVGRYSAFTVLNPTQQYQLSILTAGNEAYVSDWIDIKNTPPIDSITWAVNKDGLAINVNTHDPTGASRYYRWSYDETWEYHSEYFSKLKYENGAVVSRTLADLIFTCYRTRPSTSLVYGTSAGLSQDVISQKQVALIPQGDQRPAILYSMLLHQYTLTQDAYNFWETLAKLTQNNGSLFDALPAQLKTNIHKVGDSTVPVIGYLSGSTTATTRVFIPSSSLDHWRYDRFFCDTVRVDVGQEQNTFGRNVYIPIEERYVMQTLVGWQAAPPECVDCRLEGGSLTKPSFWP